MKMDKNKCCPGHIRQLCKSGRFKRSSCCCMVSLWQQADVYSSVWQVIKLVVWKIFFRKNALLQHFEFAHWNKATKGFSLPLKRYFTL